MPASLDYLEGKKFCIVFVRVLDPTRGKVRLQCFRGRANTDRGRLHVVRDDGCMFTVPGSAIPSIMPSDGTKILEDAEYFVFVKTDEGIDFFSPN